MSTDLSSFAARLREFITASTADPAEIVRSKASFATLALDLFRLQFQANSGYRRICEARRATPQTVTHWTQIPAVPAAAFKEFELSCLPVPQRTRVFHSSGTTDHRPSRHFHNAESLAVYEASVWPWFHAHVLPDLRLTIDYSKAGRNWPGGDWPLAILTPPPPQAPHSSLVQMFDIVRQRMGAEESAFLGRTTPDGGWVLDFDLVLSRLRANSGLPTPDARLVLLGTAFSFVHLLDGLAERNLRFQLPVGSRAMETGGYKGRSRSLPRAELHALLTQRLGIPSSRIICEYGMSESSSQAYDRTLDASRTTHHAPHSFQFPPWARAQIVSPETGLEVGVGETGLLRVFDLANVFSVLAIQTEDLAVRRGERFELLGRATEAEPRGCSLMAVNS